MDKKQRADSVECKVYFDHWLAKEERRGVRIFMVFWHRMACYQCMSWEFQQTLVLFKVMYENFF